MIFNPKFGPNVSDLPRENDALGILTRVYRDEFFEFRDVDVFFSLKCSICLVKMADCKDLYFSKIQIMPANAGLCRENHAFVQEYGHKFTFLTNNNSKGKSRENHHNDKEVNQ